MKRIMIIGCGGSGKTTLAKKVNKITGLKLVHLDQLYWKRLYRVIKRALKYYGKTRPDMPADCAERVSLGFLHYILVYDKTRRSGILQKLKRWENGKKVFILGSKTAVENFLIQLKNDTP